MLNAKWTDIEKERITAGAVEQMRIEQSIYLKLDRMFVVGLIANLQLAFRHSEDNGQTREVLEKFVRDLIDRLDPDKGNLYELLMMGFDPQFDE